MAGYPGEGSHQSKLGPAPVACDQRQGEADRFLLNRRKRRELGEPASQEEETVEILFPHRRLEPARGKVTEPALAGPSLHPGADPLSSRRITRPARTCELRDLDPRTDGHLPLPTLPRWRRRHRRPESSLDPAPAGLSLESHPDPRPVACPLQSGSEPSPVAKFPEQVLQSRATPWHGRGT